MTHKQREEFFLKQFGIILDISGSKGVEYANNDFDANANFKRLGESLGMDAKKVLFVYLQKHLDSITHFVRVGKVKSNEPIEGRVHDAILYLLILLSLIEDTKKV